MAIESQYAEKAKDLETGTTRSDSTTQVSDADDAVEGKEENAYSRSDSDHGEIEVMEGGRPNDLSRQHVSLWCCLAENIH